MATRELPSVGCYGNYNISIRSGGDTYGEIFETHSTTALERSLLEITDIDYDSSLEENVVKKTIADRSASARFYCKYIEWEILGF